ncbi:hemerythrin [Knoellia flava TL1]|uniref:Hemerythrin-like domain-containing protein n=3 Tax=Knoellia flava TaxID=913969 RepID=A0A8H9KSA5_9MICO|nr:hemerythrin [Knoellia flava TL1]GGB65335.1 hypothetical protein GCM10011314_00670 [Knoellia flava]
MCHYCGCRDMPLLMDYIAEHERAVDLSGGAVRAMDAGDLHTARRLVSELASELGSHWQGEENGLFAVMARDPLWLAHIEPLVQEHRELEQLLAALDLDSPRDRERLRVAAAELREHIAKEEDGLFPASLTGLDGDEWDASMAAWRAAHPGALMAHE